MGKPNNHTDKPHACTKSEKIDIIQQKTPCDTLIERTICLPLAANSRYVPKWAVRF